jgi:hypothetical protein
MKSMHPERPEPMRECSFCVNLKTQTIAFSLGEKYGSPGADIAISAPKPAKTSASSLCLMAIFLVNIVSLTTKDNRPIRRQDRVNYSFRKLR